MYIKRPRVLLSREYEGDWVIGRNSIQVPCAYFTIDGWFHYIIWFRGAPYRRIIEKLWSIPKTSSDYEACELFVYNRILDHLDANYAR